MKREREDGRNYKSGCSIACRRKKSWPVGEKEGESRRLKRYTRKYSTLEEGAK